MGSGCSNIENIHRCFNPKNPAEMMAPTDNDKERPDSEEKSIISTNGEEEEDELDSLSPISGTTKSGSTPRHRGLSAASTVLPGTSISLSPVTEEISELDLCKPLPDLEEFPEDIRNLLLGRCAMQEPSRSIPLTEVSLLILVNGPDTEEWLQELRRTTIPKLKELCHSHDTMFNAYEFGYQQLPLGSDYRSVIVSTVSELQRTERCITQIVCGENDLPLEPPKTILASDFDLAISKMSSADSRELFHCSYRVDENAKPPCYRLLKQIIDQPRWETQAKELVSTLDAVLDEDVKERYLKTVFEDVLRLRIRSDETSLNRVLFVNLGSSNCAHSEISRVRHLVSQLSDKLLEENCFDASNKDSNLNLENAETESSLSSKVDARLRSLVASMLEENLLQERGSGYPGINSQLRYELLHQQNEIHSHLTSFQDRPELLNSLTNYVLGPQEHPLIVHGKQGRGKSALLAVASVVFGALMPHSPILTRSCGVSPESMTQEQVLRSVCEQLCALYGEHPALASRSIAEHNTFFTVLLKRACPERPIVILLDGLDQVEDFSGRSLKWFPTQLPEHVKLILALRDESNELQELQERLEENPNVFLEVPDLDVDESLSIVKHALQTRSRRLTEFQTNFVRTCLSPDNVYPRYAHMMSHLASTWHTLNVPEHMWTRHTVMDVFMDFVSTFVELVDLQFIRTVLAAMCVLKHGISDAELLDILHFQQRDGIQEATARDSRLSLLYLKHQLSPYIRTFVKKGHRFLRFRNRYFRKLFKAFLDEESMSETSKSLLAYFQEEQAAENEGGKTLKSNYKHQRWRQYEELTHLSMTHNVPVRKFFFEHQWLFQRVCSGDPYLLLEDIKMYRRRNPDDREFDILRKVLQLSAYALRHDGTQLYTQLCGRTKKLFVESENGVKYPTMKDLFRTSILPPVPSFISKGSCLRTLTDLNSVSPTLPQSSKNRSIIDQLTWLDGGHLASFSNMAGEVVLWDAMQLKKIRTLEEVPSIDHLLPLSGTKVLIQHHERIELYDLTDGSMLVQMVELVDSAQRAVVLRGGERVLAIAEGRDEVLCFDTKTGHVDSRLEAGENRDLDCLCVSENAERCVCGDSLSKPYPLLVWDVTSRELVHQLAIPHHEYLSRLTRLSQDGSLLLTATKELLDCSPNVLMVYELKEGTLLWKGEAEFSFTATAVNSQKDYAIGATQNGPLHLWSLSTGVKKYNLHGQTGFINDIQIVTNGSMFMTSNLTDRCIRMWDAQKGSCVAAFTADHDISCCTLSRDGDHIAFSLLEKDIAMISLIKGRFAQ